MRRRRPASTQCRRRRRKPLPTTTSCVCFSSRMKAFSLAGNTALVTGSSQGIGFAIAQGLRESGATVVYHGNSPRPAELAADSDFVSGDLLDPDGPAALVQAAFE